MCSQSGNPEIRTCFLHSSKLSASKCQSTSCLCYFYFLLKLFSLHFLSTAPSCLPVFPPLPPCPPFPLFPKLRKPFDSDLVFTNVRIIYKTVTGSKPHISCKGVGEKINIKIFYTHHSYIVKCFLQAFIEIYLEQIQCFGLEIPLLM